MAIAIIHVGMARTGMPIWLIWVITTLVPTLLAGLSGGVPAAGPSRSSEVSRYWLAPLL